MLVVWWILNGNVQRICFTNQTTYLLRSFSSFSSFRILQDNDDDDAETVSLFTCPCLVKI